jgi:hypothetical protein
VPQVASPTLVIASSALSMDDRARELKSNDDHSS